MIITPNGEYLHAVCAAFNTVLGTWPRTVNTGLLDDNNQDTWAPSGYICGNPSTVAVSHDGVHLYVGCYDTDNIILCTQHPPVCGSAPVEFTNNYYEGNGWLTEISFLTVSNDDTLTHTVGDDNQYGYHRFSVFLRDTTYGYITAHQTFTDATNHNTPVAVVISPDDTQIFVAGEESDGFAVYQRDLTNNQISFVYAVLNSGLQDGLSSIPVAVSLDGTRVFITGQLSQSVVMYTRDPSNNGYIQYHTSLVDGTDLAGPLGVCIVCFLCIVCIVCIVYCVLCIVCLLCICVLCIVYCVYCVCCVL